MMILHVRYMSQHLDCAQSDVVSLAVCLLLDQNSN